MKAAYMFILPEADSKKHRAKIEIPEADSLTIFFVGVKDIDDGVNVAKSLVEDGVTFIELCGGFGSVDTAKILEAVGNKIPIGVARITPHSLEVENLYRSIVG